MAGQAGQAGVARHGSSIDPIELRWLIRGLIRPFYRDLKSYPEDRASLRARFDRIFRRRTAAVMLDRLPKPATAPLR